jgi:hemolysin D
MKRYREFLPAVLEVQDTPPSPAGRGIIWCVMLTMSAALLWAAWGKVDIVAVTQGKIVVSELSRPVNAAVTAEVAAVMVREGMHVAQGQPLIKFNDGHLQAQIKENRLRQRINRFHIARLTLLNRYYHQGSVTAQLPPAYQQEDVALAEQAALRLTAEIEADRREKAVFDSRRAVLLAQLAEGQVRKRWLKICCRFSENNIRRWKRCIKRSSPVGTACWRVGKNIPSPAIRWWPQKLAHRRYATVSIR